MGRIMKTVGIIAEYNPFHNGHLYQMQQAKKLSGADYVIVVLSGNFTQRGTPAILDKFARCETALLGGADAVFELPVCFATGSAEYFARGAVALLDGLHVDALCFGSECGDIHALSRAAAILAKEPAVYKKFLKENLHRGLSFPAARSHAMAQYSVSVSEDAKDIIPKDLLRTPNNILGIEYLKALYRRQSTMETYTLPRKGAGYSDTALQKGAFASAMALRKKLFGDADFELLSSFLPESSLHVLKRELLPGYPVSMDDFSSMLFYRLLSLQKEGFTSYMDVSKALSDKICRHLCRYQSATRFGEQILKSKDLTQTRISRSLLHILLSITKKDMENFAAKGDALYARLLGFRKSSEALLGHLSKGSIPLLSKLADADKLLSPLGIQMLSHDIFASHLYDSIPAQKTGRPIQNEYSRQIVILP